MFLLPHYYIITRLIRDCDSLVSTRKVKKRREVAMKLEPTAEQRDVIDAFKTGQDVTISAGAGCGMSATLGMLAESTSQRGLVIAFNRAVAEEASRKLSNTETTALNTRRIAYRCARGDKDGSGALDKLNSSKRISWFQVASAKRCA